MVKVPSVVKERGVFAASGEGNVTWGTSNSKVHCSGSLFLLVAHCWKCSVLVSSLSTVMEVSGTEHFACPSSFPSSAVIVHPTAELTAVMRSPMAASNTALKVLFPASWSTEKVFGADQTGWDKVTAVTVTARVFVMGPVFIVSSLFVVQALLCCIDHRILQSLKCCRAGKGFVRTTLL